MLVEFPGLQVEIDERQGTLYVHDKSSGTSLVRVSGLNTIRKSYDPKTSSLVDVGIAEREVFVSQT